MAAFEAARARGEARVELDGSLASLERVDTLLDQIKATADQRTKEDPEVAGLVGGRRARGLGQAVPLHHRHAERVEELHHVGGERRRPGDPHAQAAAVFPASMQVPASATTGTP